jgi:3-oxoacyl-[acyl-carrier-protein] synthase II
LHPRRVVVTGMGVLSPVGSGLDAFWAGITSGKSGVGPVSSFDASPYPTRIAAELKDFDPSAYLDKKELRHMDRFVQFAVAAATEAWRDAGLTADRIDPTRVGVTVGTGIGGMGTLIEQHSILLQRGPDRVSPFFIPKMIANVAGGELAMRFHLMGPNTTVLSACASSGHAVGDAMRAIQWGEADCMITGGTEAVILPIAIAGFCAMKALSTRNDDPEHASHLLGAAGAVELIASILAVYHQVAPPTINLEHPDPQCDLDYVPNVPQAWPIAVAMSNTFGFGGQNCTLVAGRYPA